MSKSIIIYIVIFGMVSLSVKAQKKFLMLDSLTEKYSIKHYTLKTDSFYFVKGDIELYNIMPSKKGSFALISVLPVQTYTDLWEKVNFEDIPENEVINPKSYRDYLERPLLWEKDRAPRLDLKLIKKVDGAYYISRFCLVEYFILAHHGSELNTPRHVINTGQSLMSIREMEVVFKKNFPDHSFIMTSFFTKNFPSVMIPYGSNDYMRIYLSKVYQIHGEKAYQFWTYAPWNKSDGFAEERGIDRFLYIPEKGIVGGSYDFYFKYFSTVRTLNYHLEKRKLSELDTNQMLENILEERIMVAEELK
ncbi:hypothetical protein ACFSQ3_11035 [Sphingobacterium corticis]|uniref:Uncharacterized protein n=1 Tax=Sphingobacterium corticis TaxID=1812823 RepID=A0ABW5NKB5_9SPHI